MARGGNVRVKFGADTTDLSRGTARAERDLKKLDGAGSKSFGRLKQAAAGAGLAIAGGLIVELKRSAEAAIEAEKSQARLEAQLKASGISYRTHAKEIDSVIQKHSQLAGIDDEDLQDAFTNIVRATGDVDKGLRLVGLAADISRAKQIDVAKAGEIVAKVANGNTGILKRYGVSVKDGATVQEALAAAQEKFAGQAKKYGETTGGSVDRANVAFENLEETIGKAVAPTIANVADKLAKFVTEMDKGTGAGGRFVDKLKAIKDAVAPVVKFFVDHPKLIAIAVGAWAAYRLAATAALAATRLKLIGQFLGLSGRATAGGAAAGAAFGTAAAGGAGLGSAAGKFRRVGRVLGTAFRVAFLSAATLGIAEYIAAAVRKAGRTRSPRVGDRSNPLSDLLNDIPGIGSLIPGGQTGGIVRGAPTPGRDSVPAMLEPGEFVMRKAIVDKYGPMFFAQMNAQRLQTGGIVARANALDRAREPYLWGGGHGGGSVFKGVDCSGAVSYVLGIAPRVSGQFTSYGSAGAGPAGSLRLFANAEHIFMQMPDGRFFGTSRENPGGGAGYHSARSGAGFVVRHIKGIAGAVSKKGQPAGREGRRVRLGISKGTGAGNIPGVGRVAGGGLVATPSYSPGLPVDEPGSTPGTGLGGPEIPAQNLSGPVGGGTGRRGMTGTVFTSMSEYVRAWMKPIDQKERAGRITPAQAHAERRAILVHALNGGYGPLSESDRLDLEGDLRELDQQTAAAAAPDLQARLEQAELKAFNANRAYQLSEAGFGVFRQSGDIGYGIQGRGPTVVINQLVPGSPAQNAQLAGAVVAAVDGQGARTSTTHVSGA